MTKQETIEAMEWAHTAADSNDLGLDPWEAAYAVARAAVRDEVLEEVFAWREDILDREEGFDQMMSAMNGTTDE